MERTTKEPTSTEPSVKKGRKILKKIILIILILLLFGLLVFSIYIYSATIELANRVTVLEKGKSTLTTRVGDLEKELATNPEGKDSSNTPMEPQTSVYDGNFVALSPNSGLGTNETMATFEFTPHKDASKYTVELKMMGQANYPDESPSVQSVKFDNTEDQPSRIQVTFNVPAGDYQWRVSAFSMKDGVQTLLQSTESWNYQVFN